MIHFQVIVRVILLCGFIFLTPALKAQNNNINSPTTGPLYTEIRQLDSLLFDAFNRQDMEKFRRYFSKDLEVFQDNIGVRNFDQSMEAFKQLFQSAHHLKRELVKGSMEVYPIKGYGAIETGSHTFCHVENGEFVCGTFKFVHVWRNIDGVWQVTRIITYNHPDSYSK